MFFAVKVVHLSIALSSIDLNPHFIVYTIKPIAHILFINRQVVYTISKSIRSQVTSADWNTTGSSTLKRKARFNICVAVRVNRLDSNFK